MLFVVLQSKSLESLGWSSAAWVAMIVGLPSCFIGLGRLVISHARGSEFSLLIYAGMSTMRLSMAMARPVDFDMLPAPSRPPDDAAEAKP